MERQALVRRIEAAIARLEPRQAEVARLRLDGLAHSEIAQLLGISEASSRVCWHRARQRIQHDIREEGWT